MKMTIPNFENITFRACYDLTEFEQVAALQAKIWGDVPRELLPTHMLVAIAKAGGQIFGAFHDEQMVGYLLGLIGIKNGECYIHSHMTGILPDYQHCGLGYQLKLKQREDALARHITRVEWTFDPLKLRNAYFNFNKLGALAKTYLPNVYGTTVSHFDQGMPTDRLLAEWQLDSSRVVKILQHRPPIDYSTHHKIFVPQAGQNFRLQLEIREKFQTAFAQGLIVTGVERVEAGINYCFESIEF